jgi:hypothetical protein
MNYVMYNDYINIICLVIFFVFFCFISYFLYTSQIRRIKEGMENNSTKTSHSINSNEYYDKLKMSHNSLKTKLNIPEYRTDYENIIIEMHDYTDGLMLNELLNVDPSNITNDKLHNMISNINTISSGKDNLNKIMKYVDNN